MRQPQALSQRWGPVLFDQPMGTTGDLQYLLCSAPKQGPSPENLRLCGPKMPGREGSSPGVQWVLQGGRAGGWQAQEQPLSTSFIYCRPVIKYSGFAFVSLSLPLCVSLPEDLFLRMKSWIQLSSFFFLFWRRSHPILKYLCLRPFDCLRIWEISLFLLSLEDQLLKMRLWPMQYRLFFEESRADIAAQYEMLRAFDFHGLQLELVAFAALQDRSCADPCQAPTPTYSFIFNSWKKYGWKNLNIMMMSQVLFTKSHLVGQLENFTRAMVYFSPAPKKPQWKPPSMPEKFDCKVKGGPDALRQNDNWSVGDSG